MKTSLFLLLICLATQVQGQIINPKIKAKRAAENRVNNRIDKNIDKGMDEAETAIGNLFKKKDKENQQEETATSTGTQPEGKSSKVNAAGSGKPGQSTSFLDFVPGTNLIFSDNFEQDALMDFPAKWNSTGSGKVVTIDGIPGKWLEISHDTYVNPVLDQVLPENCTIEFDLVLRVQGQQRTPMIFFGLTEVTDIVRENIYYKEKFYTKIARYAEPNGKELEYGIKFPPLGNKNDFPLTKYNNKILRVSMALNKERMRVYLDQTKIVDLPRILSPKLRNNFYLQNGEVVPASEIGMFVGNVRIAGADTDARSLLVKDLLEKGKASTSDILFDVNKEVIKPSSYPVINQIGTALKSNPSLRIKIVGHTDADGDPATNKALSEKRAASVKNYLMYKYDIAEERMQAAGKGASQPVAENSTDSGKARNRRVEFIKI